MAETLIKGFKIRFEAPPCTPGAEWWHSYADLEDDISEVLPYLNSELTGCIYIHENKHLTSTRGGRIFVFTPFMLAISPMEDRETADLLFSEMVETINNTWSRRKEITPDYSVRKPLPTVLDIFRVLPGTNCGRCGFQTCMAYAAELRTDPGKLTLCPDLKEEEYMKIIPR